MGTMRIKLTFQSIDRKSLILPIHYNHLLQSLIYRLFPQDIALKLHEEGFRYQKRAFKLFTFSRILNQGKIQEGHLLFDSSFSFFFATPKEDLIESLTQTILTERPFDLRGQSVILSRIEICPQPTLKDRFLLRFLSPITIYQTDAEKKTHFYSPSDALFEKLLTENTRKKYILVHGKEPKDCSLFSCPSIFPYQKQGDRPFQRNVH